MRFDYDRRIRRAEDLIATHPESAELLRFYIQIARFQKTIFDELRSSGVTAIQQIAGYIPALIDLAALAGPERLREFTREHSLTHPEELLAAYWEGQRTFAPEAQFFARALVQPYAESLAARGVPDEQAITPKCPFCGANPVAGILRGEGDGAKRSLLCSICATEWPFRRVICPNCGEENKERLPFYSSEVSHVRIDACDSCKTYLKSIDLTKDGHAVPIVDELAAVALDLWADERGYAKLEANLLGI